MSVVAPGASALGAKLARDLRVNVAALVTKRARRELPELPSVRSCGRKEKRGASGRKALWLGFELRVELEFVLRLELV